MRRFTNCVIRDQINIKIICQIHYKFKDKERSPHHLTWNQEQRAESEKACFQGSVHCGGEHEHTAEKESVYQTSTTVYLKLYENSATYGRRVITSVIANPFIEKKLGKSK